MERSLRNVVKEVYKNSDNNGSFKFTGNNRDKSSNTSQSINISLKNKNNNNENGRSILSKTKERFRLSDLKSSSSSYSVSFFILLFLFVLISAVLGLFYIYYDEIMVYLKQYFYDDTKEKEISQKMNEESQKLRGEISSLKNKLKETNKKSKQAKNESPKKTYGDLKESERKLYSQDQFVKDHGFCYIGEENNQRHCVEVYNGDICESGDVYKRIDKCMVPAKFA